MKESTRKVTSVILVVLIAYFLLGLVGVLPAQYDVVRAGTENAKTTQISEERMEYHDNFVKTDLDGYFQTWQPISITNTKSDYLAVSVRHWTQNNWQMVFIDKNFTEINEISTENNYFNILRYERISNIVYGYQYNNQYICLMDASSQTIITILNVPNLVERNSYVVSMSGVNGYFFITMYDRDEGCCFLVVIDDDGNLYDVSDNNYNEIYCMDVSIKSLDGINILLGGANKVFYNYYELNSKTWHINEHTLNSGIIFKNCRISSEDNFNQYVWFNGYTPQNGWQYAMKWDWDTDDSYNIKLYEHYTQPLMFPCDNSYYDETFWVYNQPSDNSNSLVHSCLPYELVINFYIPNDGGRTAGNTGITIDNYYNYSIYVTGCEFPPIVFNKGENSINQETFNGYIYCLYNDYLPEKPPSIPTEMNNITITVTQAGDNGKATVDTAIPIEAQVECNDTIDTVRVLYKGVGSDNWQSVDMTLTSGDGNLGLWSGNIPAQGSVGTVTCQVYAKSSTGNEAITSFFDIYVEELQPAPTPAPAITIDPTLFYGSFLILFTAVGVVVNYKP